MNTKCLALVFGVSLLAPLAWANDAGDLVFPQDRKHKPRVELLYENVNRDIRITSTDPSSKQSLSADAYALRIQTEIGPQARLDIDLGALSAGDGHQFMGGVGLRFLAFDMGAWRGGAFGQVRYAPDVRDAIDLPDRGRTRVDYNWVEADAGFLVAYRVPVADRFEMVPYAGPVFSILRFSGNLREDDDRSRFRAEENRLFGFAAGLGLTFQGMNGLRFEARYFDDLSISVAASMVF